MDRRKITRRKVARRKVTRRKVARRKNTLKYKRNKRSYRRRKRNKRGGSSEGTIEPVEGDAEISVGEDGVTYKKCLLCGKQSRLGWGRMDSHVAGGCVFRKSADELNRNGLETGFDEERNVFYVRPQADAFVLPNANIHDTSSDHDIMYEDDNVCILRPELKRGVLVFSIFEQPEGIEDLCTLGLKSAEQLQKEGVSFGRSSAVQHPYIFFRAPHKSGEINYSSVDSEIASSFTAVPSGRSGGEGCIFIRVDPEKTYVYSSEIRADLRGHAASKVFEEVGKSRKTMIEYLSIIKRAAVFGPNEVKFWNLHTSEHVRPAVEWCFPVLGSADIYPYTKGAINLNSEVLVQMPHLTPEHFVLCQHF